MNPKYRPLLFNVGLVLGGLLALLLWANFIRLGGWFSFLCIVLAIWFAMGIVSLLLLRRQNRRR